MRYKLAVFDMDGTILDTLDDLCAAANYMLREMGYPERTKDEVRMFVGNGLRLLVDRALPAGHSPEEIDDGFEILFSYYKEHNADFTRPYDGIFELIQEIRKAGLMTAVVSNKADPAVQVLVEEYFPNCFDAAAGERPEIKKKPAPDMVFSVLEKLGVAQEEAVYIGDSDVDIETARNSGLDEILVEWGFRGRAFLEERNAARIVASVDELKAHLLRD